MIKSLIRTFRGPSQDPRMANISRPLPRDLHDEQVLAALDIALAADPNPDGLVETLPAALWQVTGRRYEVLDRSASDVTGTFRRSQVMIREGAVGLWPGYEARAYPLHASVERSAQARAAIMAADGQQADTVSPTNPAGKPGCAPPPPVGRGDEPA
jgi:hypothetical protein